MEILTWNDMDELVQGFNHHKIYAFPTDTVYGVGVAFGDLEDLMALKSAKHRPEEKPIPMMVASLSQIEQVANISPATKKIIDAFMPGALTIIVPLKESISREYTNGKETIAIRMPDSKPLLTLIERIGRPLMVSSANVSGEPAALTYEEAEKALPHIDGIIQGECQEKEASTIVDCVDDVFKVVRKGPISQAQIDRLMKGENNI